jgi:hypothetical protein
LEKKETFWADAPLCEKLSTIPKGEKSTIIRMALRQWFGITSSKSVEPITADTAQLIARELMQNMKG